MAKPHKDHGYIDFVDGEELFWCIETLWAAVEGIDPREVPIDSLPWREDDAAVFSSEPPKWGEVADHFKRAMGADLSYPIIIDRERNVWDGMHRIFKAHAAGHKTLQVVTLDPIPPPDRVRPLT